MELLTRRVRFGDVGPGRLLHHTRILDWLIVGDEALAARLDADFEAIVAGGGIPHMPVVVRVAFDRYPSYGDRVTLHGTPVAAGETSFTAGYTLVDDEGDTLARATVVHVTVDAEGTAQPVPAAVADLGEAALEGVAAFAGVDHALDPDDVDVGDDPFGHAFTVRSAQIEAVGQGYFEEYFREMARALEAHLADRNPSLAERIDPPLERGTWPATRDHQDLVVPFVPTGLAVEFPRPVFFEDRVDVEGRLDVGGDGETGAEARAPEVTGHFRLGAERGTQVRCLIAYGAAGHEGTLVGFPTGALEGLR